MNRLRDEALGMATDIAGNAQEALAQTIGASRDKIADDIKEQTDKMIGKMQTSFQSATSSGSRGLNDDEFLEYVPDRRRFSGVGLMVAALLCLFIFPSWLAGITAIPLGLIGIAMLHIGFNLNSRVEIPDGSVGVVSVWGKPIAEPARQGRNWNRKLSRFIPYIVSKQDIVVNLETGNFTRDYGSITLSNQLAFRIEDAPKFVASSTPSLTMKFLDAYARFHLLRIITSIEDSRVKFTGTDSLDNFVDALNASLSQQFGIKVLRAAMPNAENDILEDLERIRVMLEEIKMMDQRERVEKESAIKEVEGQFRTYRRQSRVAALQVQQAGISLETSVAESVSAELQSLLISARRQLVEKQSEVRRELANMRANVTKAAALRKVLGSLDRRWKMRTAALKRQFYKRLVPQRVDVVNIDGFGTGMGAGSFGKLLGAAMGEDIPKKGRLQMPRPVDNSLD